MEYVYNESQVGSIVPLGTSKDLDKWERTFKSTKSERLEINDKVVDPLWQYEPNPRGIDETLILSTKVLLSRH